EQIDLLKDKLRGKLELPVVVPLLVTDQVESALLSGRHEKLRELALAVSAAYAGIGGDVDLSKVDQAIEKAAGRSYRSLFTVGRLSDNALRVRIAARVLPTTGNASFEDQYETMARSHFVTALVIVPRDVAFKPAGSVTEWNQPVHVATRFEYRWPDNGRAITPSPSVLTTRSNGQIAADYIKSNGYGVSKVSPESALLLAELAQGDSYNDFMEFANTGLKDRSGKHIADGVIRRLYLDLQTQKIAGSFDTTEFLVRMRDDSTPSFGAATTAALTDTGTHIELFVNGVSGLDASRVTANWEGVVVSSKRPTPVTITSMSAEMRGRSQLVVKFPSLIGLKIIEKGKTLGANGVIKLEYPNTTKDLRVDSFLAAGAPPAKPVKPSLKIDPTKVIGRPVSPATTVNFRVAFEVKGTSGKPASASVAATKKTHFVVEIEGGGVQVKSVSGDNAVMRLGRNRFVVYASGVVTFELENLPPPNSEFEIKTVVQPKGAATPGPGTEAVEVR
ncbi:MAG: hypothetical protein AB8F26_05705, partial [Phycisphaerales bacterium]